MEQIISPVGNRHPNSFISDQNKTSGVEEEEIDLDDFEELPLPSKGIFYMPPNFCKENLKVRPMDFTDEDLLTTQKFVEDGSVFDRIVTAVIKEKNITANKLVPIDRDTILIWLRANSLGHIMEVEYKCTNPLCKKPKNIASWDLSKIEIPEYDPEILAELKENGELKVVTPLKNITVYIKVPLIEESNDTQKRYLKKKENDNTDQDYFATASLNLIISGIEINDKVIRNKSEILNYFKKIKLPISDSRWIRTEYKKIALEYNTKQDLVCANCGNVQEGVSLPIVHKNFFWSDTQGALATS